MKCPNCGDKWFDPEVIQRGVCPTCGKSLTVKDEGTSTTQVQKFRRTCRNCGRLIAMDTPTPGPCPYCGADYQRGLQSPNDHWSEDATEDQLSRIAHAVERNAKATEGIFWFLVISALVGLIILVVSLAVVLHFV